MPRLDELSELATESTHPFALRRYQVKHVDLSASRVTAAAQQAEHVDAVQTAIEWAQREVGKGGNRKMVAILAVERFQLELARKLLTLVAGDVSVEVDARLAYKRRPTIEKARNLWAQLEELEADTSRLLLKLPATWEGIEAARKLKEKNGIRCHLTMVFGMHQLAGAAQAEAEVVSPPVGRITDFHKKRDGVEGYPPEEDPGVRLVRRMQHYLARYHPETHLMPVAFRGFGQAAALAGTPRLSLPQAFLEELEEAGEVQPVQVGDPAELPLEVDAAAFQRLQAADVVASAKLSSGVKNLSWAVISQEKQLVDWISQRQDEAAETSTLTLFKTWDYDNDGYIDREEWAGTDEVFNSLDRNNDGRISLEEMALGLGAPHPDPEA